MFSEVTYGSKSIVLMLLIHLTEYHSIRCEAPPEDASSVSRRLSRFNATIKSTASADRSSVREINSGGSERLEDVAGQEG